MPYAVNGSRRADRFSQLLEDGGPRDYFLSAIIALKLGDESGFLRVRDQAISRFNGTTEPWGYENVMQAGLLRPLDNTSAVALDPFVQFLERAVASAEPLKEGTYVPASWDLALLGLFEYRRGNYAKALDCCQRSLVTCRYMAMPAATDRVIRAMCFSKLGDECECPLGVGRGERSCPERSQYWIRQVELASVGLCSPPARGGRRHDSASAASRPGRHSAITRNRSNNHIVGWQIAWRNRQPAFPIWLANQGKVSVWQVFRTSGVGINFGEA